MIYSEENKVKYRDVLGYSKSKKKVDIKKEPDPTVLEKLQEELGYKQTLKEVGAASLYRKHIKCNI